MKRMIALFLVLLPAVALSDSEVSDITTMLRERAEAARQLCDLTFYCATTKVLVIFDTGTDQLENERFMFSLKNGELRVSEKGNLLGDGTANYKITRGECSEDGKLKIHGSGDKYFKAEMWGARYVEYSDGALFGIDSSGDSTRAGVKVFYATCETFE